jgi:hypothetical protein
MGTDIGMPLIYKRYNFHHSIRYIIPVGETPEKALMRELRIDLRSDN